MTKQIDLTHTEPESNYGELLLGAVFTRYDSDGEIYISTYDVRDVPDEEPSQVCGSVILTAAEVLALRDWLNEVLDSPEPAPEIFPGTNAALDALTIRKEPKDEA